jgi:hypothetical protein
MAVTHGRERPTRDRDGRPGEQVPQFVDPSVGLAVGDHCNRKRLAATDLLSASRPPAIRRFSFSPSSAGAENKPASHGI